MRNAVRYACIALLLLTASTRAWPLDAPRPESVDSLTGLRTGGAALRRNDVVLPDAENIKLYRTWAAKLPSEAGDILFLFADLMEKGLLPTEFLEWNINKPEPRFFIARLPLDPQTITVQRASDPCVAEPDQARTRFMSFIIGDDKATNISCPAVNQFYILGHGADVVKDAGDDDIIASGGGGDALDIGPGRNILVFDKGWGKAVVRKDCTNAEPAQDAEYVWSPPKAGFGGIGTIFGGAGPELKISGVLAGSPAEKAGLRKGDVILSVGDRPVAEMHDVVEEIRGPAGTAVSITYRRGTETPKTIALTRQFFRPADLDSVPTEITHYHPPYTYANFIVFGRGVKRGDVAWDDAHTKLIDKSSGDEISFTAPPCFNLVFGDEAVWIR